MTHQDSRSLLRQSWRVDHGECAPLMAAMPEASVDAIVTDPPYGIGFMGHEWDQPGEHGAVSAGHGGCNVSFGGPPHPAMEAGRYDLSTTANRRFQSWCETWAREALRVLKPGGHMLVFGGTRTYHRMVAGVEDAGFDVRDQLQWLFGSGFPKSKNLGDGRGTALKPGYEPILLARKPFKGSATANVAEHGTGGLNIDACRIEGDVPSTVQGQSSRAGEIYGADQRDRREFIPAEGGRWPANVVLDEEATAILDEQTGTLTSGYAEGGLRRRADKFRTVYGGFPGQDEYATSLYGDSGGASRFFYCAKADTAERNAGLAETSLFTPANAPDRNLHPTVKPIDLMRWLVRLVTPAGGTVLDPFAGSGTTGCATALEGFNFIGVEREADYVAIARARLAHWSAGITEAADAA